MRDGYVYVFQLFTQLAHIISSTDQAGNDRNKANKKLCLNSQEENILECTRDIFKQVETTVTNLMKPKTNRTIKNKKTCLYKKYKISTFGY